VKNWAYVVLSRVRSLATNDRDRNRLLTENALARQGLPTTPVSEIPIERLPVKTLEVHSSKKTAREDTIQLLMSSSVITEVARKRSDDTFCHGSMSINTHLI
jgi:hypothetical protein